MLQTSYDAIDLRPENTMALEHARMEPLHGDMLSMDELPVQTWDLWHRIKGLVLVRTILAIPAFPCILSRLRSYNTGRP